MYKLYDWLTKKISIHMQDGATLVDVGAYHGDFTQNLLASGKFSKGILFEPNAQHFDLLDTKFAQQENIRLFPYALGNQAGAQTFNCSQDDATGSLLQYDKKYHHEDTNKTVRSFSVDVRRFDDFYNEQFANEKIGLMKIDTQGFDLEVLKGAEQLIKKHKPWLVIELNFLSFYASQAPVNSVFTWLSEQGYNLGGLFNDHYSSDEWLAFADGVFVPEGVIDKSREPFYPRVFSEELIEKNKYLQSVCDERLQLIEQLHNEAHNRLGIINRLKSAAGKTKKKFFWF